MLMIILAVSMMAGCSDRQETPNKELVFKGKIYYESSGFGGKSYIDNTGTCVYTEDGIKKLLRYYHNPAVTRDGQKLAAWIEDNDYGTKNTSIYIVDLVTNEVKEYPQKYRVDQFDWFKDKKKIVYIGHDSIRHSEAINNIFLYDFTHNNLIPVTSNKNPKIKIFDISLSPNGKKIVCTAMASDDKKEGRVVKIVNLETKREETLPFSSGNVAWSPNGKTIALSGIYSFEGKREFGQRIILYDVETKEYRKLDKPGGKDAYQWEKDLVYSPDGTKIAFVRIENNGRHTLWMMNADGTNRVKLLDNGQQISSLSWTE